jgi:SAM-dependent methyltransferase
MSDRPSWPLWRRALWVLREEGFSGVGDRLARVVTRWKHRWRPASPDVLYREEFFAGTRAANRYADAFADFLSGEYAPRSVLDIGCGDSLLLAALAARGVDAFGVDGSTAAVRAAPGRTFVFKADLTQPLVVNRFFDLVLCIEVAEHLPPKFGDIIVGSIAAHARAGIIFSAAHPGQGGEDHLNEQPLEYWLEKFRSHSFEIDRAGTDRIRSILQTAGAPAHLPPNIIVLRKFNSNV